MSRLANCPECEEDLKANAKRCSCGWKLVVTDLAGPKVDKEDRRRCIFESAGVRCVRLVTIDRMCREHYDLTHGGHEPVVPPPQGFDALFAKCKGGRPAKREPQNLESGLAPPTMTVIGHAGVMALPPAVRQELARREADEERAAIQGEQ